MSGTQRAPYNKRKSNQQQPSHGDYGHQQANSVPNGNATGSTLSWAAPAIENQYPMDQPLSDMASGATMAGGYPAPMRIPPGANHNQVRPTQMLGNSPSMTFPPNGAQVVFQQTLGQVPLYTIYQTPSGPHQQMPQGQVRYQVPFYPQQQPMYQKPTYMPGIPQGAYYPNNYPYNQQQPGPAKQQTCLPQQQQQTFAPASYPPPPATMFQPGPQMSTNVSQQHMTAHSGPVVVQTGTSAPPQAQNYPGMYNNMQTAPPPPDPQDGNQGGQPTLPPPSGTSNQPCKNVLAIVDPVTFEVQNKKKVKEAQKNSVELETASGRSSAESFTPATTTAPAVDSAHESRASSNHSAHDGRPGIAQEFMCNVAQVAFEPDATSTAASPPTIAAVSTAPTSVGQSQHSPVVVMDEEHNETIGSVEFRFGDSPDVRSNDRQGNLVTETEPSPTEHDHRASNTQQQKNRKKKKKKASKSAVPTSAAVQCAPSSADLSDDDSRVRPQGTLGLGLPTPLPQSLDVRSPSTDRQVLETSLEEGELRDEDMATSTWSWSELPSDDDEDKDRADSLEERKAAKYLEWVERMRQLLDNKEEVTLETCSYGREFLGLCGEIVQESGEPKCPLSEDVLKSLGLDRSSMRNRQRSSGDGQQRFDNQKPRVIFTTTWMVNAMATPSSRQRNPYSSHASGSNNSERSQYEKLPPILHPSIEQTSASNVKLRRSKNAWKPERKLKHLADPNDTEAMQLYKDVRGLLNKITPSNFAELSGDFLKLEVHTEEEVLSIVIDMIFDKAVNEPMYCPLYSDLCKEQVKLEMKMTGSKSDFRSGILTKCQQTFETKREEALQALRKEAEAEIDEKEKAQLLAECEEAERKERQRMFGNIRFIGELYRNELLVPLILQWCVVHLFQRYANTPSGDEESVECAVKMLETIGKIFDRDSAKDKEMAQKTLLYYQHLQEISKQNGWVPRKVTCQGPKTLKEVRLDAKKEELANKIQRDEYDRLSLTSHFSRAQSADATNNSLLVTDNSLKLSITTLTTENVKLKSKLTTLEEEKLRAILTCAKKQEELDSASKEINTLSIKVNDLTEQLTRVTRQNEDQEEKILLLEEKITALERSMIQTNEISRNQNALLSELHTENEYLRERLRFATASDTAITYSDYEPADLQRASTHQSSSITQTSAVPEAAARFSRPSRRQNSKLQILFDAVQQQVPDVDMKKLSDTVKKLRNSIWNGELPKDMKSIISGVVEALKTEISVPQQQSTAMAWSHSESNHLWRDIQTLLRNGQYECKICLTPCLPHENVLCCPSSTCNEPYHRDCVNKWLFKKSDCPNCRKIWVSLLDFPPLSLH